MEQQTVATLLTGLGVAIALATYLRSIRKDLSGQTEALKQNLDDTRTELSALIDSGLDSSEARLGGRIDQLADNLTSTRTELSGRIDQLAENLTETRTEIGARIDRLDQKVDDGFTKTKARMAEHRSEHRSELADVRAGLRALEQRFFEILLPQRPAATGTDNA